MRYLLLNSLKSGGAERVAPPLSHTGLFEAIILLEKDQDYKVDIPVFVISNHTWQTSAIWKTFFIPIYAWRVSRLVKKSDVVISFVERSNFVNIVASFIKHQKTVLTVHTNLEIAFKNKLKGLYFFLIKKLYPRATSIVSVSEGVSAQLKSLINYRGRMQVIYNPLELDKINEASLVKLEKYCDFLDENQVIINVGRVSEPKGQWNLLRIFNGILKSNKNTKLLILGDGSHFNPLKIYAEKLGLRVFDGRESGEPSGLYDVFLLGNQENPYKFYPRSTVFALSSLYEGFSMVIIEAMACGLPAVSSDCNYGPREIISPRSSLSEKIIYPSYSDFGLLLPVPQGNMDSIEKQAADDIWVETISSFLANQEMRMAYAAASKKRAEFFSLEKIKDEWQSLFELIEK